MTSDAPQPEEERRSYMVPALIGALVLGLIVVAVWATISRSGGSDDGSTAAQPTGIVKELTDAGYKKVKDEKSRSAEAGRDVVTEWWERSEEPQQVIITDDSPYTTEGVMVVNAVNYRGSDGKGNASCQPDPEHSRSPLKATIDDANKVRAGMNDGSLKPAEDQGSGFPYRGEYVGCRR